MTPESDPISVLDFRSAVDVGRGYYLAWIVKPDGSQWPALVDMRVSDGSVLCEAGDFRNVAPHEMTGRLPGRFELFRCGAPTRAGSSCRHRVAGPKVLCAQHRERATSPATLRVVDEALFELDPGCES